MESFGKKNLGGVKKTSQKDHLKMKCGMCLNANLKDLDESSRP
jgi:hypothetical protein